MELLLHEFLSTCIGPYRFWTLQISLNGITYLTATTSLEISDCITVNVCVCVCAYVRACVRVCDKITVWSYICTFSLLSEYKVTKSCWTRRWYLLPYSPPDSNHRWTGAAMAVLPLHNWSKFSKDSGKVLFIAVCFPINVYLYYVLFSVENS